MIEIDESEIERTIDYMVGIESGDPMPLWQFEGGFARGVVIERTLIEAMKRATRQQFEFTAKRLGRYSSDMLVYEVIYGDGMVEVREPSFDMKYGRLGELLMVYQRGEKK